MKPRKSISELRAIVLQRRLRLACQAGRIMAGHECGIVRGPLPPLPKQGQPVRLREMTYDIVKRTIAKHGGNKTAAGEELGIKRQTITSILRSGGQNKLRNVIQLAQAAGAVCLVFVVGCGSLGKRQEAMGDRPDLSPLAQRLSPVAVPPLPQFNSRAQSLTAESAAPVRVKTNGVVNVAFDPGEPPQTVLVNQSTGQTYALGLSTNETIGGIRPGLNTFTVTNSAGASAPVTALVTADTNSLVYHGQMFRWPGRAGTLQRSTDTVRWFDVRPIQSGEVILQTNNQAREFLRVKL